jgi:hypothetical protein
MRALVSRGKGLLVPIFATAGLLASASVAPAASVQPSGTFTPGAVQPPPPGLTLHGDVVWRSPGAGPAAASAGDVDVQNIPTADGLHVRVETSPHYLPSLEYDEGLVGFLDSLLHGNELNNLRVYVATPSEMSHFCGGLAAACFIPNEGRIYIVGEESFGGFPTTYVLAHEYGHRIEAKRRNPPFPGGPLAWGTKRWASVEGVCRGALAGRYAPGNEGRYYFENPGEAFAESYAWSQFGSGIVEWRWAPSLHPNVAAYAAIRSDVLDPWAPEELERQGRLTSRRARHAYTLRPKGDGRLQVRMTGSGGLDIGLFDSRGRLLAVSARRSSSERLHYVVCGDRNLRLVVLGSNPPGRYRLKISLP